MLLPILLSTVLVVCNARPQVNEDTKNVVTVPPNCPEGQQYINGQCRDVWTEILDTKNVVSVPNNCPAGQQWINGHCRDVWREVLDTQNVVSVPNNCPEEQQLIFGQCRDVWTQLIKLLNTATVPPNCPNGQQLVNGICRDIWTLRPEDFGFNVVTVPPNCPPGQELINGECRDIWIKLNDVNSDFASSKLLRALENADSLTRQHGIGKREANEAKSEIRNRNIITVPNQCPSGSRPDALGICRPIFD